MLLQLINGWRRSKKQVLADESEARFLAAASLMRSGDLRGAIAGFRNCLKVDPFNVKVLNDLGVCLSDTGNLREATVTFELAYSLDDSFSPVVVNHAKVLSDQRKSTEALPYLRQAKLAEVDFSHADAVYASICLNLGDAELACHFQLQAWLANFDNLRLANCYLFYSSYNDIDERLMAAEHRFWAETLTSINRQLEVSTSAQQQQTRKVRIGYWSPDLRNHSVRYFFRPLLENHDAEKFEIYLYHDFPAQDHQTSLLRQACDKFHDVSEISDMDLSQLLISHELDILVELAGHSSNNRVNLLQQRLASVQISGLGYPPTTGLASIDAKILDRHVVTSQNEKYYAEAPLLMPTSFWCFDPMEDAVINLEPPCMRNGFITFGCVGNIAKISVSMLGCWCDLLHEVPASRLLLRSINFLDPVAIDTVLMRVHSAGIDEKRVQLLGPVGGAELFGTYNEIDIILDTFPFNGGTTTCFATYMGVPVVSQMGDSLLSRMGLSVLSSLDVADLVVPTREAYLIRAVALAADIKFLEHFRREARSKFQSCSLGNGKIFARDFEKACLELIDAKRDGTHHYQHAIDVLPANEIVRRAYTVLRRGQLDAAGRIVDYCLRNYPDCGSAHLLVTQLWESADRFEKAIKYLEERMERFSESDQISVRLHLIRLYLLVDDVKAATEKLNLLDRVQQPDPFDRLQLKLFRALLSTPSTNTATSLTEIVRQRVVIVIPCDETERFEEMSQHTQEVCVLPKSWSLTFLRCKESDRITVYKQVLGDLNFDVVIWMHKNIEIHHPHFLLNAVQVMEQCDVVGFAGATRWNRLHWSVDTFEHKAAGLLLMSSERSGFVELQWTGHGTEALVKNMAVLDGNLLLIKPERAKSVQFDEELIGALALLEEDWTHAAHLAGLRLAVHRNLGVFIDQRIVLDERYLATGRVRCADKYGFDPFAIMKEDRMLVSAPVVNADTAVRVCQYFVGLEQ